MFPCPCIFKLNQIKFKQAPLSHLIGTGTEQHLWAVQEASGEPNNLSTDAKYNVLIAAKLSLQTMLRRRAETKALVGAYSVIVKVRLLIMLHTSV